MGKGRRQSSLFFLVSRTDECPFPAVTALGFGRYDMGQEACSSYAERPAQLTDTDTSPYICVR